MQLFLVCRMQKKPWERWKVIWFSCALWQECSSTVVLGGESVYCGFPIKPPPPLFLGPRNVLSPLLSPVSFTHQNNKQETVLPVLFHHTSPYTCIQYLQALGAMLPVHVLQRSVISHKYNSSLIKLWYAKVSGKLISYWHFAKFNVKLPSLNMLKISKPLRA